MQIPKPFQSLGCKPFQEKMFEIGILSLSDSVLFPDSEYGPKIHRMLLDVLNDQKLVKVNLRNFVKILKRVEKRV